jgi:hypothetical protein
MGRNIFSAKCGTIFLSSGWPDICSTLFGLLGKLALPDLHITGFTAGGNFAGREDKANRSVLTEATFNRTEPGPLSSREHMVSGWCAFSELPNN